MAVQMVSSNMKISNVSANSKQQYEDKDNHKSKKWNIIERKKTEISSSSSTSSSNSFVILGNNN